MDNWTLAQKVRAARGGDDEALTDLVTMHRPAIVVLAARLLGDAHEAEDVAQESLATAWTKLHQLHDPARFAAWLNQIVINNCRRRARAGAPMQLTWTDQVDDRRQHGSDRRSLATMLAETGRRTLDLPTRQAVALHWFYFHGASCRQIAARLETTEAGVRNLLQRARNQLRRTQRTIREDGQAMMEHDPADLELLVSMPTLLIEQLKLAPAQWTENQLRVIATNRSSRPLYLALDVRASVMGGRGGWHRQHYYDLRPGQRSELSEHYRFKRVLSPWYAVYRGPGVGRLRLTFAVLSAPQHRRRAAFFDSPDDIVFQKWFDVAIPADGENKGIPVQPALPQQDDVTLESAGPGRCAAGDHEIQLTLRNHTETSRNVYVHVDTPGWGNGQEFAIEPGRSSQRLTYHVHHDYGSRVDADEQPAVCLRVLQLPLNFNAFDIEDERFFCRWEYARAVDAANVAVRRFALS